MVPTTVESISCCCCLKDVGGQSISHGLSHTAVPFSNTCLATTIQFISEKNLELDKQNDRTFIDGYKKIIENVGNFRLDVGHMLMFGVIAVTFNRRD